MNQIKTIAFTHKTTDIANIGKFYIAEEDRASRLLELKDFGVQEVIYLATCNRVELIFVDDFELNKNRITQIFQIIFPNWNNKDYDWAYNNCALFEGTDAVDHLFRTTSSLDSLVIGEREIITQVKNAYNECQHYGTTGDLLRILITKSIECAKKVYTNTNIARNPVSVVSLAFRTLKRLNLSLNARVLVIGAGDTNTKMCKFLYKFGFKNFTVVNRTLSKAESLAQQINGKALALSEINQYTEGFDLMVTCTGSKDPIFDLPSYSKLLNGEQNKKVIVDLAMPNDIHPSVVHHHLINYIEVGSLKKISEKNLAERSKELVKCEAFIKKYIDNFTESFQQRQVEIAMRDVPMRMKEIKEKAFNQVFAKDIESLDENGKEVLEKMFSYLEKKYISVPMKMAKEIMTQKSKQV